MAGTLFGRDVECAHLERLLDTVESGPVACILDGTPGIGKTTLWREAVEIAHHRGYQVLETAPSEPEAVLAFSGLGDLFERIPDEIIDALPEAHAHALRAALSAGELTESARDHQALPRAILDLLRQLSAAGPVLIAIDDEPWLDPASARVLAFALCRLRDERVIVLLARRSEAGDALSTELARRFRGRGVERISVEPLPMGAMKVLLEARLDRTISAPVLRRIHQGAGGNPLWALAIALELEARRSGSDRAADLPIPRTLSDALELRLRHLDPRAHAAMLAIAALSQPTLAMVHAAIPEFALSDLESAERAGVIEISGGRLRFTHPLLASTHYANTPVSKRRELHRLLATVIDDEEERAQHGALGAEAPDRELADSLEKAAAVAARRGATESAAQLLEDAARLTPIDQGHVQNARLVAAAEYRFHSGDVRRARYMLEEVMPHLPGGPLRARAGLVLAEIRSDESRLAVELLEAALEDAGEDDRWRTKIELELTAGTSILGRLQDARAHAESAVRTAERLDDPDLLATALGDLLLTIVIIGEPLPRDLLTRLSTIEDFTATTTYHLPATKIGMARHWAGDLEGARPALERAAQRALSRGEEWDRLGVLLTLAQLEWEMGNLALAEQHRNTAEEALGEFGEGHLWLVAFDVTRALQRGELTVARAKAEDGLALTERTGAVWLGSRLIPLLAAVEILSGQPEAAHARLAELREWLQRSGFGPAGSARAVVWSQDVEALIALGRLDEAEDVLADLRVRAEVCESDAVQAVAARCDGLLLAARGDLVAAIDAMDGALAAHLRRPRPFERGRTLLEKGSIERRARRKAAAKQTLEQALAILEPLEAEVWVARARDELSRIGLRRARATEGLTPAQTRVAELAAAGSTNAAIARELHMSPRTVESHLSRIYREHGVTSRSQLAAAFATGGSAPGGAANGRFAR
jgi:DNA-binding NarL/FixJ family response regulator